MRGETAAQPFLLQTLQGASPDEVALVEAGRRLGFEFVGRSREDVDLKLLGHDVTHRILDSMEFTSARARLVMTLNLTSQHVTGEAEGLR